MGRARRRRRNRLGSPGWRAARPAGSTPAPGFRGGERWEHERRARRKLAELEATAPRPLLLLDMLPVESEAQAFERACVEIRLALKKARRNR